MFPNPIIYPTVTFSFLCCRLWNTFALQDCLVLRYWSNWGGCHWRQHQACLKELKVEVGGSACEAANRSHIEADTGVGSIPSLTFGGGLLPLLWQTNPVDKCPG